MKIGILTFHWATNYGAVLQCYALQSFLESKGYNVEVINYKPHQYDDNFFTFLYFRKFLYLRNYLNDRKKESALADFRNSRLHQTVRVSSYNEIPSLAQKFDIIISGSDQVVNPSFLMNGEGRGRISPTYFLGFPFKGKRIGYALSFGCVRYPEKALKIANKYIKDFNIVSVREKTGIGIAKAMGREDAFVVPDPTLLMESQFYHTLVKESRIVEARRPYIYSFFIRNIAERKNAISSLFVDKDILLNNDDGNYTMQDWLHKINYAEFVITDSFHCVVMCLKLHRPFAVITGEKGNVGMNDRLYTLLNGICMGNRIIYKNDISNIISLRTKSIEWQHIDDFFNEQNLVVNKIF